MCEHCTPLTIQNFPSEQDFKAFEKILEAKSVDGTFIRVITADDLPLEPRYQCTFCTTDWILSVPERSWSGYFLPAEGELTVFEDHQTNEASNTFKTFQSKSNKNCGCCLLLVLVFLGLIVYGLYSFASFLLDLLF